jgi:hypothetical protein
MKIYFHNINKYSSFALSLFFFLFALFIIDILFSNDTIKLRVY